MRDQLLFSFEMEHNYSAFTGINPRFTREKLPAHLINVMTHDEATKLIDAFENLFEETQPKWRCTVLPLLLCLVIILISTFLSLSSANPVDHLTSYLCAMFIPVGLWFVFLMGYGCYKRKGKRKRAFREFIDEWNTSNTERGLALGLSNAFWESVYPENVPNIYIQFRGVHLFLILTFCMGSWAQW